MKDLREEAAMTLCILEKEFPPLFVQCNDTFDVSPSGGVGSLWSCAHQMDVPYRKVHEDCRSTSNLSMPAKNRAKVRAPGANGVEAPSSEWERDCYETQAAGENGAILGPEATK